LTIPIPLFSETEKYGKFGDMEIQLFCQGKTLHVAAYKAVPIHRALTLAVNPY
jgi:hypothetical protein